MVSYLVLHSLNYFNKFQYINLLSVIHQAKFTIRKFLNNTLEESVNIIQSIAIFHFLNIIFKTAPQMLGL